MRPILWLALSLSLAVGLPFAGRAVGAANISLQQASAQATSAAPATPATPASSKIWIGRYAEFEEFLRTAPFVRWKNTEVGVLNPKHGYFAPSGLAGGAAVKPIRPGRYDGFWESYKSEIAAYKLDRILELDMVPPTVERRVEGETASVQLWVEDTMMLKQVNQQKLRAPDQGKWNFQRNRVYVFDDLVGNIDENEGNLLFDKQWNFIKIDHSRAFTNTMVQPFEIGKKFAQIDRSFFNRVKALDKALVKREIGDLLEGGTLDAMFARRDKIVKDFEKLAAQKGAEQVILP